MTRDFRNDAWLLRLCDQFERLAKELSHVYGSNKRDDVATYDDAICELSKIYGRIFPGRSLFSSIVLPSSGDSLGISDNDKQDIARCTAKAMEPEFQGVKVHVTAETNREIAAKAPKRTRKFGHEGNGLKGPKTRMMVKQKNLFSQYLVRCPEGKGHSRISRAHELWFAHAAEWEKAARATGEAKGYSSHKALAAAK